jgi:hypothetical protein
MLLAGALGWPATVQFALGLLALVTLVGTVLLLTDWNEWLADRANLRRERAARKRARSNRAPVVSSTAEDDGRERQR